MRSIGALVAQAIANEIGDGADLQRVFACEHFDLWPPRHGAIVVHELAQHSRRLECGEAAQVDRRFGVSGANQHAATPRPQRKDVSRPREVGGG